MGISINKIKLPGVLPGRTNPLPLFKSKERETPCSHDETFREEDKKLFGYETGFRVLPYKMQDSYDRNKTELELDAVDLENERLRARFLPALGGRLISLYDKTEARELLFANPVLQPANLATRNAWFSGGIEWNISQFGHSCLTCEPVYFARMTDSDGNAFLRMYEYERSRKIFVSVDFHLPPDAVCLGAHMRIVNDNDHSVPMYWWTNIALREEKDIRIFSGTDQVIYIKPESNIAEGSVHEFGRSSLEALPSLKGKDASQPMNFNYASEYFFQTPAREPAPWEAAAYNDGTLFFERSSSRLRYRKMFCWGTHKGGRNWCDYLSVPGRGDYLEIQAGLAPTQIHGLEMPAGADWSFSQFFGSAGIEADRAYGRWSASRDAVKTVVEDALPADTVDVLDTEYRKYRNDEPEEILHFGSGWGALENELRSKTGSAPLPGGFLFPPASMSEDQAPWKELLNRGRYPDDAAENRPPSWMTDSRWKDLLQRNADMDRNALWPRIHLGVMAYEEDEGSEALSYWQDSLALKPTAIAWRNIAVALKDWGQSDQALDAMRRAAVFQDEGIRPYIMKELLEMLVSEGQYGEAWRYYKSLPPAEAENERIVMAAAVAAFHEDQREFLEWTFSLEYAHIKEGETRLADLWYRYQARLAAEQDDSQSESEHLMRLRKENDPPSNIDFTMTERE